MFRYSDEYADQKVPYSLWIKIVGQTALPKSIEKKVKTKNPDRWGGYTVTFEYGRLHREVKAWFDGYQKRFVCVRFVNCDMFGRY